LGVKLPHLAKWNQQRRDCATLYQKLLASSGLTLPYEPAHSKSVYHLFVVLTPNREELQERLNQAGVGTGIHYPIPLHLQNAYQSMKHKQGDFPVCERVASTCLSLPMFPGLEAEQQERVAEAVAENVPARVSR
jgi:dTDP-4-amino-4,6-dideoxygalactose transaminase